MSSVIQGLSGAKAYMALFNAHQKATELASALAEISQALPTAQHWKDTHQQALNLVKELERRMNDVHHAMFNNLRS